MAGMFLAQYNLLIHMYNQLCLDVEYKCLCQYQHLSSTKSGSV